VTAEAGSAVEPQRRPWQERAALPLALLAVYIIWGSTYFAIRVADESLPPFTMSSIRFLVPGAILYTALRLRGVRSPRWREWMGAGVVGALLLGGGNGLVALAEKDVASGLAALIVATVPLWAALFARMWGHHTTRWETVGLGLGLVGVALLNVGTSLRAHPFSAVILLAAAASWSLGTVWGRTLPMPAGLMGSAAQMLVGGAALIVEGISSGEQFTMAPTTRSLLAVGYLIAFGSLIAFVAYGYLMRHARPALATSYAFVNPAVAVVIGAVLGSEAVTSAGIGALVVIALAVGLVVLGPRSR
jgi:drug/metabolite transporter (DMT)-like permease